jgi:hypothetical protein
MLRTLLACVLAVACCAAVSGSWPATTRAAKARVRISYTAYANPGAIRLCVGDAEEISVEIERKTVTNGQQYPGNVTGGYILGVIDDTDVGEFEPTDAGRPVGGPDGDAKFVFRAKKPGRTNIEFTIRTTGEEQRVRRKWPTNGDKILVEVRECWEAYTSGLASVFDDKDMGALDKPFLLVGHTPNVGGITTQSQYMFFAPNPQNNLTGGYAFIDTGWATADPRTKCTAYVSGRYDVVFYPDADHPVEGDLLMKGSGQAVCASGTVVPIDYQNQPGFQIGIKPRPAP